MPTTSGILSALETGIKQITVVNGYKTDLLSENVFSSLSPLNSLQKLGENAYPRVFIISEGADYQQMPARRIIKDEVFTVLAVFAPNRNDPADVPLETQTLNFIDDFEKWADTHAQIGGCDLLKINSCANDAESAKSEAVVMFEINVTYKRTFT